MIVAFELVKLRHKLVKMTIYQDTPVFRPCWAILAGIPRLPHEKNTGIDYLLTGEGADDAFHRG